METFTAIYHAFALLGPPLICTLIFSMLISLFYHSIGQLTFARKGAFILMFGIFGSAIGCIVGASSKSEISAITTAIITLASGYITFLTSKEQTLDDSIKLLLPGALISLLFCMLVSLFYMRFYFASPTT